MNHRYLVDIISDDSVEKTENGAQNTLFKSLHTNKLNEEIHAYERIIENFQNQIESFSKLNDLNMKRDSLHMEISHMNTTNEEYKNLKQSYDTILNERKPLVL